MSKLFLLTACALLGLQISRAQDQALLARIEALEREVAAQIVDIDPGGGTAKVKGDL
jgi:hypothetical protein